VLWAEAQLKNYGLPTTNDYEPTLAEFASGFFTPEDPHGFRKRNERRHHDFPESYYSGLQARLDNWILPKHGHFLLSGLNDVMIEDFILDIPRSDDTKSKILVAYRYVLDTARREDYLNENPAERVKMVTVSDAKERQVFTSEELSKMSAINLERLPPTFRRSGHL
jgi:hypothetical protein